MQPAVIEGVATTQHPMACARKYIVTCRFTLLHLACGLGQAKAAELLLGAPEGVKVNDVSNAERLSALHAAAMAGSLECAQLLLRNGKGFMRALGGP